MLETWFLANKRSFPWRDNPTPYRVWISEVMLQQTRATVVVGYFEQWMTQFPTIQTLANAPIEQVIKTWEGLGYYSRARNIHKAAQIILRDHGGELPSCPQKLSELPGLGPYTVGAIISFGFRQKAVAIDGNVTRVVSRFAWIDEEISKSTAKRKLEVATAGLLCANSPWVSMEALIELGARICTPNPVCEECPLKIKCVAYAKKMPSVLPIKKEAAKIEKLTRGVAIVEALGHLLLKKNGEGAVMSDLWEFPYFEGISSLLGVQKGLKKLLGCKPRFVEPLLPIEHSFTRFSAKLFPYKFTLEKLISVEGYCWVALEQIDLLPFSSGHRKLVKQLYRPC